MVPPAAAPSPSDDIDTVSARVWAGRISPAGALQPGHPNLSHHASPSCPADLTAAGLTLMGRRVGHLADLVSLRRTMYEYAQPAQCGIDTVITGTL